MQEGKRKLLPKPQHLFFLSVNHAFLKTCCWKRQSHIAICAIEVWCTNKCGSRLDTRAKIDTKRVESYRGAVRNATVLAQLCMNAARTLQYRQSHAFNADFDGYQGRRKEKGDLTIPMQVGRRDARREQTLAASCFVCTWRCTSKFVPIPNLYCIFILVKTFFDVLLLD